LVEFKVDSERGGKDVIVMLLVMAVIAVPVVGSAIVSAVQTSPGCSMLLWIMSVLLA
jgi:hypothetical protein